MRAASLIAPIMLALVLLAGCGKKGSPDAPGPASEISYPRTYPSR